MSPYERRRRSNVLSGDEARLPNDESFDIGQRDSGHLAVPSAARWPGTEPAISRRMRWSEAVGKPRKMRRIRTSV